MTARTNVLALLNTLSHERHTRAALLAAFGDELRAAIPDQAPESTRALTALARAERGDLDDAEVDVLLTDIRAIVAA